MSTLRRLTNNSAANGMGIVTSLLLQLLTVPALISAWGAHAFGVWTMMATIPAYLALSDLGFTDAACIEMTLRVARDDRAGAQRVFQTTVLLLVGIAVAVVAIAGAALAVLAHTAIGPDWLDANGGTLFGLIVFSVLALLSRIPTFALRATGHYALGTFCYDGLVLIEGLAVIAVALLGGGFYLAVAAMVLGRVANLAVLYPVMRHKIPWLQYGIRYVSRAEAKYLMPRALGALAIPGATAIQIQMSVLIVGAVLSPLAVAIYVPVRTASRIAVLLVYGFSNATMPEISAAAARDDRAMLGKLIAGNALLAFAMLVPGGVLFAVFGSWAIGLWTGGALSVEQGFVALMATAMVLHGSWNIVSRMLLAINRHGQLAMALAILSLFSLPMIALGAYLGGLSGTAAVATLMEAIYLILALRVANSRLTVRGYMRAGLKAIVARALSRTP